MSTRPRMLPGSVRVGVVALMVCAAAISEKTSIAERATAIFITFIGPAPLLPRKLFGLINLKRRRKRFDCGMEFSKYHARPPRRVRRRSAFGLLPKSFLKSMRIYLYPKICIQKYE